MYCVKNRAGNYIDISKSFSEMLRATNKIDSKQKLIGLTDDDIYDARQADEHKLQDRLTWKNKKNSFIEAVVFLETGDILFLDYHSHIDKSVLVSDITPYRPVFIERIVSYCPKERIFRTKNGGVIKMQELSILAAYLGEDRVNKAANRAYRGVSAVEKSVKKTAQKLDYPGPKELKIAMLSVVAPMVDALTKL